METEIQHENTRAFKGVWIPAEVWLCKDIGFAEKALYAEISSLDGDEGCFASNAYFSEFFGLSERMVRGYISALKDLGFIYVESFNGRTRVLRTTNKMGGKKLPVCPEENFRSERKKISAIYNSIEKSLEKDTPKSPQGDVLDLTVETHVSPSKNDERFEEFWKAFPKCERKIGKAKCRELWVKRNLDTHADAILKAIAIDANSHDWKKDNGQFIPMPQTWLNRKRYEDIEPSSPESAAPSSRSPARWAAYTSADTEREHEFIDWVSGGRKSPPPPWSVHTDEWVSQNKENIIQGFRI